MARRGLGGAGDWSGAFASLYSFNKNEEKARQDAADQDAADKWANGLMSDDEWVAYIRTAIERESGDPKRQTQWITALRKYTTLIADKQAEADYEMGGSINQLIAHYQERLEGMVKDSNEYREVQLHLNDLLDKRSGEKLTEAAEAMVKEINLGKKTYQDLKGLLAEGLEEARDNSQLKKSIQDQIDQVNETIRSNALEGKFEELQYQYDAGKISGGTYAKRLRSMAVQFKDNDPKRYYQILQAAVALEKRGAAGGGGGGGGGRSGGGGGGGGGGASKKSINAQIDLFQAERNAAQALLEQFEAGATKGVDPATGQVVVFTDGIVRQLDEKVVKAMDKLTAAYTAKGDHSAAANTQKSKAYFIANNVTAHNTFAVEDTRRELLSSTSKLMDSALSNPDPTGAMNTVRYVAQQWDKFSKGLTEQSVKGSNFGGDIRRRLPSEAGEEAFVGIAKGQLDQVDPRLVAEAGSVAAALAVLADPTLDDATAEAALGQLYMVGGQGSTSSPFAALATSALEINGRQQGLSTGDLVRIATPNGLVWAKTETISVTAPDPVTGNGAVQVEKKVPVQYRDKSGKWVDLGVDGNTSKLVDIFIDINGTPTKVQAIATQTAPQGFDGWVATETRNVNGVQLVKGRALTETQIKKLGTKFQSLKEAGDVSTAPILTQWTVQTPSFTDKNGKSHGPQTWNQDPVTGMWYLGALPIRGARRDADGMVIFTDSGAAIDWKAYGSALGVPAPYAGNDAKAMQDRLNNGEIDISGVRGRDLLGNPVDDALDLDSAYWRPGNPNASDEPKKFAEDFLADKGWWDDGQRASRATELKQKFGGLSPDDRQVARDGFEDFVNNGAGKAITDTVSAVAKMLGINLGGTQTKPSSPFGGKSPDERDSSFLNVKQNLEKKRATSSAPLVKLPTPGAKSGPEIKATLGDLGIAPRKEANAPRVAPPAPAPKLNPDRTKDDVYKPPPKPAPPPPAPSTQKRGGGFLS